MAGTLGSSTGLLRLSMRNSFGFTFIAGAMLCVSVPAQTVPPEGIVRAPEMIVQEGAVASDAAGVTRTGIEPESSAGQTDWEVLNRSAANFHVDEGGAGGFGTLFALRGVANTPYFSEPAVTVYWADIPLSSGFTYPEGTGAFTDVTLYRGPQGTEFGRASDGGVLVFQPPPADAWRAAGAAASSASVGGEIAGGAGSYSERNVSAAVGAQSGGPDGAVAAAANASYEARKGYIFNSALNRDVDPLEREQAFALVKLRASPAAQFAVEGFATRERDGAQPLVPLGGPLFQVSRANEGVTDLDSWGAAVKAVVALPFATVTSVTSLTDWRMNPYVDFLVLPPPLSSKARLAQKTWNEELRFVADGGGAVSAHGGVWLSKGTTGNFIDRRLVIGKIVPYETSGFDQSRTSAAAFADAVLAPAPGWQFTAGVRAEADEKHFTRTEEIPVPGLSEVLEGRYDAFLPKLSAAWAVTSNEHLEASVAWGLRPGGFSSYTDNPALMPFPAERMTAYAAGWDWATAGRSFAAALRGFYNDVRDYQIERSFNASDYFVATAPRAHTDGAEAEFSWRPAAGWSLGATGGWTEARLDRYRGPFTGQDGSGHRAPYIPRFTSDLELAYRPARGWFAAADLAAVGRTNYDELGTPKYIQGGYATWNARAGYAGRGWTLTAYVDNLTDERHYDLVIPGVNSAAPGAPRRGGAEIEERF
jgi:hypothetical protein